MPYKNKKLADYSQQIAEGVPVKELTDWTRVPEVIKPQLHKRAGKPTALQAKKNKKGWYPEETRIEAVALYATFGNVAEVARILGMQATTIRQWKMSEWWHEMMNRVHDEKDEELDTKFTKTIDLAMDEINDRLVNGEYVHNPKTGITVRVKPKMRDIAFVSSTHIDKRQLLRGKPTSRTEKVSQDDRLGKLAKEFAKFVGAVEVEQEAEVVIENDYANS